MTVVRNDWPTLGRCKKRKTSIKKELKAEEASGNYTYTYNWGPGILVDSPLAPVYRSTYGFRSGLS
jgi:hypothetical protein